MKISIKTESKFPIPPYQYMQFMEPLSATDASVDAGWDYVKEDWEPELIRVVQQLAPTMIRWGGCFSSYYHWQEAVGRLEDRIPVHNQMWGGLFSNHVGTREFIQFCRKIQADPMILVNMECDGRMGWAYPKSGMNRFGTAKEAAEWVDYCNNPDNVLRKAHGDEEPYGVKYWQIGNETSYDYNPISTYKAGQAAMVTRCFAQQMKAADPGIKLIAWGDDGWAKTMCEAAGEEIDLLAFHYHYYSDQKGMTPLQGTMYRDNWEASWEYLMNAGEGLKNRLDALRQEVSPYGKKLAMTEGHFALPGRNRCDVLSTWAAGVAYGKLLNLQARNGDILEISTNADFFGTCWQVNAIMCTNPIEWHKPYLQPVGWVMSLFGAYTGDEALSFPENTELDITASRRGNTIFLHVVNDSMNTKVPTVFEVEGETIESVTVHEIKEDIRTEISYLNPEVFKPSVMNVEGTAWTFPPASVSVAILQLGKKEDQR